MEDQEAAELAQQDNALDEAHKDTLEFALKVSTHGGVEVPVEVTLTYPKDFGLYAVQGLALAAEGDHLNQLFMELVDRQDGSVIQKLLASGHQFEED
jgi:hypothetical protein